MHGQMVPVRAHVARLDSMSAHAGRGEILRWLETLPRQPERLCLVHGETGPMDALADLVEARFRYRPHMPAHQERIQV
jgi:metallo-beta-lactamase family protein